MDFYIWQLLVTSFNFPCACNVDIFLALNMEFMKFTRSQFCFTLNLSGNIPFQFFKSLNITADQKKFFRKVFHTYYDAASELLQSEHTVRDSLSSQKLLV